VTTSTWFRRVLLRLGLIALGGAVLLAFPAPVFSSSLTRGTITLHATEPLPHNAPRAISCDPWLLGGCWFVVRQQRLGRSHAGVAGAARSADVGVLARAARLNPDFALTYAVGRFRAGLQLSLMRDARGLLLQGVTFARYVTPTFHIGVRDNTVWLLETARNPTHALSVSAGVRRAPNAPALSLSSTVNQPATSPSLAGALFAAF
jgi:hypothetical protein